MLEKLKPCPYCGEKPKRPDDFFGADGENLWSVSCENVHCHVDIGVWHEDEDEAIRMWNALPRPYAGRRSRQRRRDGTSVSVFVLMHRSIIPFAWCTSIMMMSWASVFCVTEDALGMA